VDYKKYDIIRVKFFGSIGSEQGKERPAIIIQNDIGNKFSPTLIVLPLTSEIKNLRQSTHMIVNKNEGNGLSEDSMLLAEQVRTIDKSRIIEKMGRVDDRELQRNIFKCFINSAACDDDDEKELMSREA